MKHRATESFWHRYALLPKRVRKAADKAFELIKLDAHHPSLHLKRVGELWSVRVSIDYRALALEEDDVFTWVWIGHHSEYDRLLR